MTHQYHFEIPCQKGEIFLKNISQYPAIYDLEIPGDVDGIELDPHEGVLQIGEIRRIDFKFTPQQSGKFDFPITAKIRNGKSCSIRIGGSVQEIVIKLFLNCDLRTKGCSARNNSRTSNLTC